MNDSQQQQADAELVGCKVAYESGVHWLDANVRALEALRTRSLALVSVVLIAATLVASLAPDAIKQDALGDWGRAGGVIFAVGMAVLFIMSACVSWPLTLVTELGPLKIINEHIRPRLTWPSARLYKALATDLDGYAKESRKKLRRRARLYSASLIVTLMAVGGAALFWVDATF